MRRWRFLLLLLVPHVWLGIGLVFFTVELIAWAAAGRDVPAEVLSLKPGKTSKGYDIYTLRFAWTDQGVRREESADLSRAQFDEVQSHHQTIVRDWKLGTIAYHEVRTPIDSPWASVGTTASIALVWNGLLCFAFTRVAKSKSASPVAGPGIAPKFVR